MPEKPADIKDESKSKKDLPRPEPKDKCPFCRAELGFMKWCSNCRMKIF